MFLIFCDTTGHVLGESYKGGHVKAVQFETHDDAVTKVHDLLAKQPKNVYTILQPMETLRATLTVTVEAKHA